MLKSPTGLSVCTQWPELGSRWTSWPSALQHIHEGGHGYENILPTTDGCGPVVSSETVGDPACPHDAPCQSPGQPPLCQLDLVLSMVLYKYHLAPRPLINRLTHMNCQA